jgi:hypothetical protein
MPFLPPDFTISFDVMTGCYAKVLAGKSKLRQRRRWVTMSMTAIFPARSCEEGCFLNLIPAMFSTSA